MKTTEQVAPATIAELVPKLSQLTTDQPTTTEIEEAIRISKAITRALFEWAASRYSAQAQGSLIPVETPAEAEELDRIEHAHVHPHFAPVLNGLMRMPA